VHQQPGVHTANIGALAQTPSSAPLCAHGPHGLPGLSSVTRAKVGLVIIDVIVWLYVAVAGLIAVMH
jgi:hypothetical protein